MERPRRFAVDGRTVTPVLSIVTGAITRELMKASGGSSARTSVGFRRDWTLELRLCGKLGVALGVRYFDATGGATLTARKPAPRSGCVHCQYQTSLRPGWTEKDLHRAVCRAHGWFRDRAVIEARRDEVYDFSETREIDHEALDIAEDERGRDSAYENMSEDDCDFWLKWLRTMPAKGVK